MLCINNPLGSRTQIEFCKELVWGINVTTGYRAQEMCMPRAEKFIMQKGKRERLACICISWEMMGIIT